MGRASQRAGLALAALLALGLPLRAGATASILSGQRVAVTADAQQLGPRAGYLTLPVQIENRTSQPQRVSLRFESRSAAYVGAQVSLAGGERRDLSLLIPAAARFGTLSASDGYEEGHEGFSWPYQQHDPLLVEGPTAGASLAGKPGASSASAVIVSRAELPETLAALAGFGAVALLESQLEDLTEPQRRALEAYVATGGDLYLARYPAHLETLLPLFTGRASDGPNAYGFGVLHLHDGAEGCLEALRRATVDLHRPGAAVGSSAPSYRRRTYEPEPSTFSPLLGVAQVPVGGFLVLVLAFVLVIGPGSFFLRARRGPQVLVAFIPLTALATCGGIAGYGFLHEGMFTIHASSRTATLLDAERHRAITLSVDGYYASLAPASERFGALAAPMPAGQDDSDSLRLDESDGLRFTGGLIPSRSYRELLVLSMGAARERLSVRREGEWPMLENALGARIAEGFARVGGKLCHVLDVPDGARKLLTYAEPGSEAADLERLAGELSPRFAAGSLGASLAKPLAEGEFLVQLDRSVFAEAGGLALERTGDVQLVRGRLSP